MYGKSECSYGYDEGDTAGGRGLETECWTTPLLGEVLTPVGTSRTPLKDV